MTNDPLARKPEKVEPPPGDKPEEVPDPPADPAHEDEPTSPEKSDDVHGAPETPV